MTFIIRKAYLAETSSVRGDISALFITSRKPFRPVSRATISRWVKIAMQYAGIDVNLFAPGSTRGASSTKAALTGVPVEEIMSKAGWANESTFLKWYKRE